MKTRKTWALFALVCVIFGTTFLAIRIGLGAGASPFFFASLRFVSAGVVLSAFLFTAGRLSLPALARLAGRAAILSLLLTVGTFGCMFFAEIQVDSGLMARLDATGPLFTALFSAFFLGKRLSPVHLGSFALGAVGTALMAAPAKAADPVYLAAAAGSVVTYAAGNALYPRLFAPDDDPVAVSALQTLIGGLILLVFASIAETPRFPAEALPSLLWLTVAGSVVAHTATLVLVRDAGPVFASGWLYVSPAVATLAGAVVLGEPVTILGVGGMALALSGVCLLERAER